MEQGVGEPFWLSITPKSPLYLGEVKPQFQFLATKRIIAGSVIRGAVAEYLRLKGDTNKIKAFIQDMRFGFFLPSFNEYDLPFPLPATALCCKRKRGFISDKGHGIFDSLLPSLAYLELQKQGALFPVPLSFKCRDCGERMERASSDFYIEEKPGLLKAVGLKRFSQTKVALNRIRRTAEEGMLYSVTALSPELVFIGKIWSSEEKAKLVLEALNTVSIGGLTTRGYGAIEAKMLRNPPRKVDIASRVKEFNRQLSQVWKEIRSIALNKERLPAQPEELYFSICFLSPAILKEQGFISSLDLHFDEAEQVFCSAVPQIIGGWSTAWGLSKETSLAIAMGSVYAFKTKKSADKLIAMLSCLEEESIGERKDEGFGEVIICHPFHQEVSQK